MRVPMTPEHRINIMAENLTRILASESFQTIRPTLREVACQRYDWTLRAKQMISAYNDVIDQRKQRKAA